MRAFHRGALLLMTICALLVLGGVWVRSEPRQTEPRMLTWMAEVLSRPEMRPVCGDLRAYALGENRWVTRMHWVSRDQLVVMSQHPDLSLGVFVRFMVVQPAVGLGVIGDVKLGRFNTSRYQVVDTGELVYGAFVSPYYDWVSGERKIPTASGVVALDLAHLELHETDLTDSLKRLSRWQYLSDSLGFESMGHVGPLSIHDGSGATLATGTLPPSTYLMDYQVTPAFCTPQTGRLGAAVLAVPTRKLASQQYDVAGTEIALLLLPATPGGPCEVIARLSPEDHPLPQLPEGQQWQYHRLDSPMVSADGSRMIYREYADGHSVELRRLWLWEAGTGTARLVVAAANCSGRVLGSGWVVRPAGDGTVEKRAVTIGIWESSSELMCAISAAGDRIAYVVNDTLYIGDLP